MRTNFDDKIRDMINDDIQIPESVVTKAENSFEKIRKSSEVIGNRKTLMVNKIHIKRVVIAATVVFAVIGLIGITNPTFAKGIPLIGSVFKLITSKGDEEKSNPQNIDITVGEKTIITVGGKTINQGEIIEVNYAYKELTIIVDTTLPKGFANRYGAILIKCNTNWQIIEGNPPGGFARSFHVVLTNNKLTKFTLEKALDNDGNNMLSDPFVFYVEKVNNNN